MPKKSTLVPLGVLAGVLALSGGVAVVARGPGHDGTGPALAASGPSPAMPAELVQAVRATLAHRSLLLRGEPVPGFPVQVSGEADTTTGNVVERLQGGAAGFPLEMRLVGDTEYLKLPSAAFSADDDTLVSPGGLVRQMTPPGPFKPWSAMVVSGTNRTLASPVHLLRPILDTDPAWQLVTSTRSGEATRYTVRAPRSDSDYRLRLDVDVRNGEVSRVTVSPELGDLPDCPGSDQPLVTSPVQNATDALLLTGSDAAVHVEAPPPTQTDGPAPAPTDEPSPDISPACPGEPPTDFPSAEPPDLPQGAATYSGPAIPSPAPSGR